jgi:hypothetical protein
MVTNALIKPQTARNLSDNNDCIGDRVIGDKKGINIAELQYFSND